MECHVAGCARQTTKYSRLCEHHRNVDRTHGHPLQRGVSKAQLLPFMKTVQQNLEERAGPNAEQVIQGVWAKAVKDAEAFKALVAHGKPHNINERVAQNYVLLVGMERNAMDIAVAMMAMGYWYEFAPHRWASDNGFRFQTARMFKRLSKDAARHVWRADGTMVRSHYPRPSKRTMQALWTILKRTEFIDWGILMARQDQVLREDRRRDAAKRREAVLGLSATTGEVD